MELDLCVWYWRYSFDYFTTVISPLQMPNEFGALKQRNSCFTRLSLHTTRDMLSAPWTCNYLFTKDSKGELTFALITSDILTLVKFCVESDVWQELVYFFEDSALSDIFGTDVPNLDQVVFFSGRDRESADVVAVVDLITKLLANRRQQQFFPHSGLQKRILSLHWSKVVICSTSNSRYLKAHDVMISRY